MQRYNNYYQALKQFFFVSCDLFPYTSGGLRGVSLRRTNSRIFILNLVNIQNAMYTKHRT